MSVEANNDRQSTSQTPPAESMDQVPSSSYKADPVAQEEPAILEDRPITPEASASPEVPASPEFRAAQKRGSPGSPVSEPPAKRAHIEPEEKGCQTEEEFLNVDHLYKPEEKLNTKNKKLSGVDLEELVRKRVELHSENFRHVCLPFNHSLDFKSWTQEEVLEMTSQFMGAVEVEGFKLAECDGKMIWNLTKEDLFLKLNETRAIFSWRALKKFINMLEQLNKNVGIAMQQVVKMVAAKKDEKELFNKLNRHSANISVVEFLKVDEHFKTVLDARGIYLDSLRAEQQEAEQ